MAGLQVPAIPSVEVAGKFGGVLYWQSGPIWTNVGVIFEITEISFWITQAHSSVGVK